jgi:hypothetical protein
MFYLLAVTLKLLKYLVMHSKHWAKQKPRQIMGETKHIQVLHPNCFIFVGRLVWTFSFRRLTIFSNKYIFWQLLT